jgi:glycosyltransferase involved in cell wall biosynthesis
MPATLFSRRPTIAITLNTAWNIYNFRLGLAKALLAAGYRVLAIAPPDKQVAAIEATGCRFIPLEELRRKSTNPAQDVRLLLALRRIYEQEQVDLALHYTIKPVIYGTLAAHWSGVRTINTLTGLGYAFMARTPMHYLVRGLYRTALRYADRVWFQNEDDQRFFLQKGLVDPAQSGVVRGSGIDLDAFRPLPRQRQDKRFRFLFIGRLLSDKGIHELISAAQQLRAKDSEVEIHVLGALDQGNPAAIAAGQLAAWRASETIIYHAPTDNVRPFIREADALVLPSYREGLPRVMLEGLAMAKPLITTDVPGCRETVHDGVNGYLVPAKDSAALAAAMLRMRKLSAEELVAMGQAGYELAHTYFDEALIVDRYLETIRQLLGQDEPAGSPVKESSRV